jgi:hypothetical protein
VDGAANVMWDRLIEAYECGMAEASRRFLSGEADAE